MKIFKIISRAFNRKPTNLIKKEVEICPEYDKNNVTAKEFQDFVHYLAKNKINRTFEEPDHFISIEKRKELENFKNKVYRLATNNINQTFFE